MYIMEKKSEPYVQNQMLVPPKAPLQSGMTQKNARENFVDITALIRSVQRTEGNADCFRRTNYSCEQHNCSWRFYCLGDLPTPG
jgi:hypothetical protein